MKVFFVELLAAVYGTIEQIFFGWHVKAPLAFVISWYVDSLYGDVIMFKLYLLMLCIDTVTGVIRAAVHHEPISMIKFSGWLRKCATHLLIFLIIGVSVHALNITTGQTYAFINWMLLMFIITDAVSALTNLDAAGFNIPPIVLVVMKALRKGSSKRLADILGAPEMQPYIADALEKYHSDVNAGKKHHESA